MATITSSTGTIIPEIDDDAVDIDTVLTTTGTHYAWETSHGDRITLVGAFTYPSGTSNPPDGQVAQILIDVGNDGSTDLTIAFSALKSILAELISENIITFWEAALHEADTATLAGDSHTGLFDGFALDGSRSTGTLITQNDDVTITGSGNFSGDIIKSSADLVGGGDTFNVDRAVSGGTIWGDASWFLSGDNMTGGDDQITVSATSSGTELLIGDVGFMSVGGVNVLTGGDDIITVLSNNNATLVGDLDRNQSDDTINGGNDTLTGGGGDDTIFGDVRYLNYGGSGSTLLNAGDDFIHGGAGNDVILGDFGAYISSPNIDDIGLSTSIGGNDTINGGSGNDTIYGQTGNDIINGGSGNDYILGGTGNDTIDGDSGTDTVDFSRSLFGVTVTLSQGAVDGSATGEGTDIIRDIENVVGTSVGDTITGNTLGNVIEGGDGNDVMDGGTGTDTASYENASAGVTVDLSIVGVSQATFGAGDDTLTGFEALIGSAFDDTLYGMTGDTTITAGDGDDTIDAGAGQDVVDAGSGNDTIIDSQSAGPSNNDVYDGGFGTDTLVSDNIAWSATATFNLTTGYQSVSSGNRDQYFSIENLTVSGDAQLIGSSAANILIASDAVGTGNNTISGMGGNDTIDAGGGDDTVEGGSGNDTMDGGAGNDFLQYTSAGSAITIDLSLTSAQVTGGAGTDTISNFENATGSDYNDIITGTTGVNHLIGGAGSDTLNGGDGNDFLDGGALTDILNGGDGDDTLAGGYGTDTLNGGAGFDTASYSGFGGTVTVTLLNQGTAQATGPAGTDTLNDIEGLSGGDFNDHLTGSTGANSLSGLSGSDFLFGLGGDDNMNGGLGNDNVQGGGGNDFLSGGDGRDTLLGGLGVDIVNGGDENDQLRGGADGDILNGGAGRDVLIGGDFSGGGFPGDGAADTFVFLAVSDSIAGGAARDIIRDFEVGLDVIDLTAIDAITGGGNDAFTYIGSSAFSGTAGELRAFNVGANTVLRGDVDGDGAADFEVFLNGSLSLGLGEFLL